MSSFLPAIHALLAGVALGLVLSTALLWLGLEIQRRELQQLKKATSLQLDSFKEELAEISRLVRSASGTSEEERSELLGHITQRLEQLQISLEGSVETQARSISDASEHYGDSLRRSAMRFLSEHATVFRAELELLERCAAGRTVRSISPSAWSAAYVFLTRLSPEQLDHNPATDLAREVVLCFVSKQSNLPKVSEVVELLPLRRDRPAFERLVEKIRHGSRSQFSLDVGLTPEEAEKGIERLLPVAFSDAPKSKSLSLESKPGIL